jgi:hypothetical protein
MSHTERRPYNKTYNTCSDIQNCNNREEISWLILSPCTHSSSHCFSFVLKVYIKWCRSNNKFAQVFHQVINRTWCGQSDKQLYNANYISQPHPPRDIGEHLRKVQTYQRKSYELVVLKTTAVVSDFTYYGFYVNTVCIFYVTCRIGLFQGNENYVIYWQMERLSFFKKMLVNKLSSTSVCEWMNERRKRTNERMNEV